MNKHKCYFCESSFRRYFRKDINNNKASIVATISSNQGITQVPLSNNASFIDNAIHWIGNAKASFIIKTNN